MRILSLIFWRAVAFLAQGVLRVRPWLLFLLCTYLVGCMLGFLFTKGGVG